LPAGYLAQSGLLDSCNALTHTIPELSHFRSGASGDIYRRTMWVGPSGSFTPFHRDPNVGIYTQIVGRKVFHLLPPTEDVVACLEPSARELHKNTSTIPVSVRAVFEGGEGTRAMDRCRENLSKAFEAPGACEARLEQGDSVLIPEGWWHSAEGDGVGVGVNAWFK
jgi:lysine-specific demethylase 8